MQGKELPGVSGNLDLSWISTPLPPVPVASANASAGAPPTGGKAEAETEGVGEDFAAARDDYAEDAGAVTSKQEEPRREVNMDYEMPDEEAW